MAIKECATDGKFVVIENLGKKVRPLPAPASARPTRARVPRSTASPRHVWQHLIALSIVSGHRNAVVSCAQEESLDGWRLERRQEDGRVVSFTLPPNVRLGPEHNRRQLRVSANCAFADCTGL